MPRSLGRLPFFGRHSARAEQSTSSDAASFRRPIDPDLAPIGPPILLPAVIVRQVMVDATEIVPAWAMPRAEAVKATAPVEPTTTKRPRRPKATGTSAAKPATAKPAIGKHRSRARKSSDS